MARGELKTLDDMSVEEAQIKAERAIAKEKRKINKEISKEIEKQNIKNFEQEKSLLKKYSEERKKSEKELATYYRTVQELTLHEYAELHNRADKDVAEEYKKLMTEANEYSVREGFKKGLKKLGIESSGGTIKFDTHALGQFASKVMNDAVSSAANAFSQYQGKVNTRLIGYLDQNNNAFKQIVDKNSKTSPYYQTSEYLRNISVLVDQGIVQNLEQRAFLNTVKDELISTFDATNDTLTRLVRIQQEDSTAARAGMEAYLNQFLNKEFENSEYITDQFKSTSALLEEATALLSAEQATSFEYVVQKWLGALYSEGMSSRGIQSLAGAIGQLASGNIDDLVGTNIGNLIAMASKGNLATYFKDGLTEATADILMNSIVSYLQELNNSSNNVVKSQLASTFGLSISDLAAAANLNAASISGNNLGYGGATAYLNQLMGTAGARMSGAAEITNFVDNLKFSLGANIVSDSVKYGAYQASKMLDSLFDDTNLSFGGSLKLFGTGIDFSAQTSLSDILSIAALGVSGAELAHQLMFGGATSGLGGLDDTFNSISALAGSNSKSKLFGSGFMGLLGGSSVSGYVSSNSDMSSVLKDSIGGLKENVDSIKKLWKGEEAKVLTPAEETNNYLHQTFDVKMDSIIKILSKGFDFSVVDSFGNKVTDSVETIMGGNTVKVQANATEKEDLTTTISESVVGIYDILNKVVNGELQLAVREVYPNGGLIMNQTNLAWTGASR